MIRFEKWAGFAAAAMLVAGCSGVGGGAPGSSVETAAKSAQPSQQFAATVRVLPYADERAMGNPRKIGTGAENLTGFSGLHGTDLLLPKDAAAFVTEAMGKRMARAGYRVVESNAMFELSGKVKELTYNVKARDEVSIAIESTLTEVATGRVEWSGIVTEKKDRYAGVMGNSLDDVIRVLSAELGVVTAKTTEAISAILQAERPELFNIQPGMKVIPGVTVLNAAGPASAVPPAPAAGTGLLVITTTPPRAKVYIDQVYYGLSPLRLDMEPGIHAVVVKEDGYRPATEKVSVRKGDTTEVELKLER